MSGFQEDEEDFDEFRQPDEILQPYKNLTSPKK
jgi:hypothetical protein